MLGRVIFAQVAGWLAVEGRRSGEVEYVCWGNLPLGFQIVRERKFYSEKFVLGVSMKFIEESKKI